MMMMFLYNLKWFHFNFVFKKSKSAFLGETNQWFRKFVYCELKCWKQKKSFQNGLSKMGVFYAT